MMACAAGDGSSIHGTAKSQRVNVVSGDDTFTFSSEELVDGAALTR